jgi:hypothetical protein
MTATNSPFGIEDGTALHLADALTQTAGIEHSFDHTAAVLQYLWDRHIIVVRSSLMIWRSILTALTWAIAGAGIMYIVNAL